MPLMTFVTTYCRPIVDANGNQSSLCFRAGQTYNIEMTPEFKGLQERGNIFPAGSPAPKEPPKMDPPIQSERVDQENSVMAQVIDATLEKALGMTSAQQEALAKKRGWQRPETK